jgi:hypothetical protein
MFTVYQKSSRGRRLLARIFHKDFSSSFFFSGKRVFSGLGKEDNGPCFIGTFEKEADLLPKFRYRKTGEYVGRWHES